MPSNLGEEMRLKSPWMRNLNGRRVTECNFKKLGPGRKDYRDGRRYDLINLM